MGEERERGSKGGRDKPGHKRDGTTREIESESNREIEREIEMERGREIARERERERERESEK